MGCFQSKKDSGDIHPNVFRVVNIDEGGAELWSGQLEITETDLILYREGRDATIWPLASLRRYGFEGEIFSFESGRRCATGEGIYAFRCRRAGMLFRTLQQNIQMRNVIQESLPFQLPSSLAAGSPSSVPRQTLQASVVHRSSIDSGQPVRNILPASNHNLSNHMQMHTGPVLSGPRSPSSADILEVMPLYPRPQNNSNQVTNVYQVKDFKSKEHNNNQGEPSTDLRHLYSNDFNRDLAALRNTLKKEAAINCMRDNEEDSRFIRSRYMNESLPLNKENAPLSPTLSNTSEHYAQLNEEKQQEAAPLYVNIAHTEESDFIKSDPVPTTPITPKQMDYYNFGIQAKFEMNSYANLSLGDMSDNVANAKAMHFNSSHLDHGQKFSESDTTSMSPIEDLQYALLDMDKKRKSINTLAKDMTSPKSLKSNNSQNLNQTRGQHISQSSLEKASTTNQVPPGVGYTTIDFDKTVALTSVATGTDIDADGVRTTRHNITNTTCGSPTTDRHRI